MAMPVIGTAANRSSAEFKANQKKMTELVTDLNNVVSTITQGIITTRQENALSLSLSVCVCRSLCVLQLESTTNSDTHELLAT
jgi:ABC-type Fe3+/spermidine/putrescine transport system ATPase subunit